MKDCDVCTGAKAAIMGEVAPMRLRANVNVFIVGMICAAQNAREMETSHEGVLFGPSGV